MYLVSFFIGLLCGEALGFIGILLNKNRHVL
jgi:hypothetical protein